MIKTENKIRFNTPVKGSGIGVLGEKRELNKKLSSAIILKHHTKISVVLYYIKNLLFFLIFLKYI